MKQDFEMQERKVRHAATKTEGGAGSPGGEAERPLFPAVPVGLAGGSLLCYDAGAVPVWPQLYRQRYGQRYGPGGTAQPGRRGPVHPVVVFYRTERFLRTTRLPAGPGAVPRGLVCGAHGGAGVPAAFADPVLPVRRPWPAPEKLRRLGGGSAGVPVWRLVLVVRPLRRVLFSLHDSASARLWEHAPSAAPGRKTPPHPAMGVSASGNGGLRIERSERPYGILCADGIDGLSGAGAAMAFGAGKTPAAGVAPAGDGSALAHCRKRRLRF